MVTERALGQSASVTRRLGMFHVRATLDDEALHIVAPRRGNKCARIVSRSA
jgi:hypothetical protein